MDSVVDLWGSDDGLRTYPVFGKLHAGAVHTSRSQRLVRILPYHFRVCPRCPECGWRSSRKIKGPVDLLVLPIG